MDYLPYIIIASFVIAGGVVGHFVVRSMPKFVLIAIWVVFLAASAVMAYITHTTPGLEMITYAVVLYGAFAPAGVGLLIGTVIGLFKRKPLANG